MERGADSAEVLLAGALVLAVGLWAGASVLRQQGGRLTSPALGAVSGEAVSASSPGAPLERSTRPARSTGYADLVAVSLEVAFMSFTFASMLAIPLGILCGRNKACMSAMNPFNRILEAVSPLVWFPVVAIVVGALCAIPLFRASLEGSFIRSAFTVALCSLWPTLAGTAHGVASIEKGHVNVARMLKLSMGTRIRKIVVPAALPPIVNGQRISMGIGWIVIVAAEMLARSPGLAGFAWGVSQKGGRATLPQIAVVVVTIAGIGLLLDRVMVVLRRSVAYVPSVVA